MKNCIYGRTQTSVRLQSRKWNWRYYWVADSTLDTIVPSFLFRRDPVQSDSVRCTQMCPALKKSHALAGARQRLRRTLLACGSKGRHASPTSTLPACAQSLWTSPPWPQLHPAPHGQDRYRAQACQQALEPALIWRGVHSAMGLCSLVYRPQCPVASSERLPISPQRLAL